MMRRLRSMIASRNEEFQIRGQNLIVARWVAILGQSIAVLVAYYGLSIDVPIIPCMLWIALSGIINNYAVVRDRHRSMNPLKATAYLSFDIVQLTALLYLTGGLGNPFFVLLLAPASIGASLLPKWNTTLLVILGLLCTIFISHYHRPIVWPESGFGSENVHRLSEGLALGTALIFAAFYTWRISAENRAMQRASYAAKTTLLRQQQLQALGAQAAAAAHELGSPLSTIAIVAKELEKDLGPDHPSADDIRLLLSQSDRCRNILRSFGGSLRQDPTYMATPIPLDQMIKDITENFLKERPEIRFQLIPPPDPNTAIPSMVQSPELIHGLGVYIQNAIQFARSGITIRLQRRNKNIFQIVLYDDGPGFAPQILTRLGEPYISTRTETGKNMGLGIFIAQTLLEDTGAIISYDNRLSGGAMVTIEWPIKQTQNMLLNKKTQ